MLRGWLAAGLVGVTLAGAASALPRVEHVAALNGMPIFRLATGYGGESAAVRAGVIHHRLQWLNLTGVDPQSISVQQRNGLWCVVADGAVVITADPVAAAAKGTTPEDLAIYWAYLLRAKFAKTGAFAAASDKVFTGVASWYGPGFVGEPTASGVAYNPAALTCASPWLPLGSRLLVTDLATGESIEVTVNDRGPYVDGRVLDLSEAAAKAIGLTGIAHVRVQVLS